MIIAQGRVDGYSWLQVRGFASDLEQALHRHHAGHRLLVVAFDSVRLHPSTRDIVNGWLDSPAGMLSPPIAANLEFPCAGYDEWWLFPDEAAARRFPPVVPFVNIGGWTLRSPDDGLPENDTTIDWDPEALRGLAPAQDRFWELIERHRPVTYVSDGNNLVVVSRQRPLIDALIKHFDV